MEGGGCRLSPQRNFSPAPLGNPIAPSSVTFGDSSPPRGSLRVVQLYTKKRPKSGHADGHRNSPSTGTMRPTTPKPASGNERAIKAGVQGACPRPSFSPFLGRNGDPAGQAGPRGAAPRGTVRAPTAQRVRSTPPRPRPAKLGAAFLSRKMRLRPCTNGTRTHFCVSLVASEGRRPQTVTGLREGLMISLQSRSPRSRPRMSISAVATLVARGMLYWSQSLRI